MDKKKVISIIKKVNRVLSNIKVPFDDCLELDECSKSLKEVIKELNKSDWVSVDDVLPPYDESVLVTNKETPEIVLKTSRTKVNGWNTDNNGFLCAIAFTITHWKPIEKLEE